MTTENLKCARADTVMRLKRQADTKDRRNTVKNRDASVQCSRFGALFGDDFVLRAFDGFDAFCCHTCMHGRPTVAVNRAEHYIQHTVRNPPTSLLNFGIRVAGLVLLLVLSHRWVSLRHRMQRSRLKLQNRSQRLCGRKF